MAIRLGDGVPRVRPVGPMIVKTNRRAPGLRVSRATVMFADLRGYTAMAERLAPTKILPLLDEFFDVLGRSTVAHDGTIFYMAGDGMMAGFGAGDVSRDGAREALAAGYDMLLKFGELAKRWRRELGVEAGIGVGLHLGDVAMGFLGPPGQKAKTLVGDTVNVAARLCGRARAGEVLLSHAVAEALNLDHEQSAVYVGPIPVLHLPQFALRGRAAPLDIWCVPAAERAAL